MVYLAIYLEKLLVRLINVQFCIIIENGATHQVLLLKYFHTYVYLYIRPLPYLLINISIYSPRSREVKI